MYLLLIACIIGFFYLKTDEPIYALAIGFVGLLIVSPLTIAAVSANNRARRERRMRGQIRPVNPRPAPITIDQDRVPTTAPAEGTWRHDGRDVHVVEGVTAF